MDYKINGADILLCQTDFDLDQTLDCGQAFRWTKLDKTTYFGHFLNTPLTIISEDSSKNLFRLKNTTEHDFLSIWCDYFDLFTDYTELKSRFSQDETMAKACAHSAGIRLLKQNKWEALSSFIISQNNNIPRIKGIISRLCEHYNGYPSALQMVDETVESLAFLRSGFRAKYLVDAVQKINCEEINLDDVAKMPLELARKELMKIKGVGPKVAECALLFGMYRVDAFPVDVWIKRALERFYPNGLPDCIKGNEGIAQQFLFDYIRRLSNDKD